MNSIFVLEEAKKLEKKHPGRDIITESGKPVKILSWSGTGTNWPIVGVVDGEVHQWSVNGDEMLGGEVLRMNKPAPKSKKVVLRKAVKPIAHTFKWHPVSEKAKELDEPIIFLTDKGKMVTHSHLRYEDRHYDGTVETVNLFSSWAAYANAVAWVYQKELFNLSDFVCGDCNNVKGCVTCTNGDQYCHITEIKTDN